MCLHVDDNQSRVGGVPLLVLFVEGAAHSWLMWTIPIFATLQIRDPGQVYSFVSNTPFSQQRNEKTLARSIILCQIPPPGRPCHPPRSKSGGTERGLRLPTMTS